MNLKINILYIIYYCIIVLLTIFAESTSAAGIIYIRNAMQSKFMFKIL